MKFNFCRTSPSAVASFRYTWAMSTPKRPKRPRDPIQRAYEVFQEAIGERPKAYEPPAADAGLAAETGREGAANSTEPTGPPTDTGKDPAAVSLGRRGGLKGGPARAAKLTAEQRSEIGRKAAAKRWGKSID